MASDKDLEKLESMGWVVECTSPFEAYHEESNSRVTGVMGKSLLMSMLEQEAKDEKWANFSRLHDLVQKGIIDHATFMTGLDRVMDTEEG